MNTGSFPPARRRGLLVYGVIIAVLAALAIWSFQNLSRAPVGPSVIVYLLVILVALPPLPFFGYRAFALL